MQELINRYYSELISKGFLRHDEEAIIGKAKDVLQNLKDQIDYTKNPDNNIEKEDIEFIVTEANELMSEIEKKYKKNDVIKIFDHPMSGFYVLQDKESLFEELKQYYEEMEEN